MAVSIGALALTASKPNAVPADSQSQKTRTCRLRINVRSKSDGRSIAKALIRFLEHETERRFQTDANGIAVLDSLQPRPRVLEVRADGYAAQVVSVAATEPGTTADLGVQLEPGGQIRGTVRDERGRPISEVAVTLARTWNRFLPRVDERKTDAAGRYFFDNVPRGQTLEVSVEHRNRWKRASVLLTVDQMNATADIAFEKQVERGSIVVNVTGPGHKPIAGAQLKLLGSTADSWRKATTDANGDCRVDDVEHNRYGRYTLLVRAKGFAPTGLDFTPGTSVRPSRMKIELAQGHSIRARVMLTDGKPAAHVRIIFDGGETEFTFGGETRTDSQGRFTLDSLSPTCTFTIEGPADYAPFQDMRLALDRKTETTVTLDTTASVNGRVVDGDSGKPVVPFRVRARASRMVGEPQAEFGLRLRHEGQVHLRPDGSFKFSDLPPGAPIWLRVAADGYVSQSLERVVALPDGRFKPLEIRLHKIEPQNLRTVSGKLTDAEGKPVAGADLRFWTAAFKVLPDLSPEYGVSWWIPIKSGGLEHSADCQQFLVGVTGKEGEFTFRNVRVASCAELAYWKKGIAPGRKAIHLSADSEPLVNVPVKALAPSRLTVEYDPKVWPNGALVQVVADSLSDFPSEFVPADRHRVTFDDLPTGELGVSLNGWSGNNPDDSLGRVYRRSVTIKSGQTAAVRFTKR